MKPKTVQKTWLEDQTIEAGHRWTRQAVKQQVIPNTRRIIVRLELIECDPRIKVPSRHEWDKLLKWAALHIALPGYPSYSAAVEELKKSRNQPLSKDELGKIILGIFNLSLREAKIAWSLRRHPKIRKKSHPCYYFVRI
jgi:hypothetical protein